MLIIVLYKYTLQRLWSVRGKRPEDYPKKLLMKDKGAGATSQLAGDKACAENSVRCVANCVCSELIVLME